MRAISGTLGTHTEYTLGSATGARYYRKACKILTADDFSWQHSHWIMAVKLVGHVIYNSTVGSR